MLYFGSAYSWLFETIEKQANILNNILLRIFLTVMV